MTRILYGSDFHGSEAVFRKFLASGLQYKVNALMVGGDVTGKAMVPVIHQGGGRYMGHLFGADKVATTADELEALKKSISNVGFYPIVLEKDEAVELESDPARMGSLFEQEMCNRVRDWMKLAEEKLVPANITLYFMPGNDDLYSIDKVLDEFEHIRNPDMKCFEMDGGYSVVGLSNANMTPWRCARDIEEPELAARLEALTGMIQQPERTIAMIHVPPISSGLDTCPELDKNLKIITQGGQVVMKAAGSPSVKAFIEKVQPMLTLHGHIHESPGHVRNGRTLMINAGSEYAEGIMKAAIVNLEDGKVKGHLLVSRLTEVLMGKYGDILGEFYEERTRIVNALAQPENQHILMRLIGALAFRTHCPKYGYIQDKLGRVFTDFDFVSYPRFIRDIRRVLTELGYEEDKQVTQLFGDRRMVFHDPAFGHHIDVFYNILDFCHPINFVGRLEKDLLSVPLAELVLEKMQIVQINEKDLIDTVMLLREHPLGDIDDETINTGVIVRTLANDWGFWRTVTGNLKLVDDKLAVYNDLSQDDRQVVHNRIQELRGRIDAEPKSLRWKARAQVGERVKWYKDVEELER